MSCVSIRRDRTENERRLMSCTDREDHPLAAACRSWCRSPSLRVYWVLATSKCATAVDVVGAGSGNPDRGQSAAVIWRRCGFNTKNPRARPVQARVMMMMPSDFWREVLLFPAAYAYGEPTIFVIAPQCSDEADRNAKRRLAAVLRRRRRPEHRTQPMCSPQQQRAATLPLARCARKKPIAAPGTNHSRIR